MKNIDFEPKILWTGASD